MCQWTCMVRGTHVLWQPRKLPHTPRSTPQENTPSQLWKISLQKACWGRLQGVCSKGVLKQPVLKKTWWTGGQCIWLFFGGENGPRGQLTVWGVCVYMFTFLEISIYIYRKISTYIYIYIILFRYQHTHKYVYIYIHVRQHLPKGWCFWVPLIIHLAFLGRSRV